jgi:glutaminyl-peptide cyclotransferase
LRILTAALTAAVLAVACSAPSSSGAGEAATPQAGARAAAESRLELTVVATYPHDPGAFTQGLLWHRGRLYESTGMWGRSSLREVELESGRVVRRVELEPAEFAEGLALAGDRLYQLSFQSETGWVWDLASFAKLSRFAYRGEGWGLTFDGTELIQSDGSSRLTFRSPADFSIRRELSVLRAGRPQLYLNELEWVNGEIWANIWQSDEIVRIDPRSGEVTASFDASQLLTPEERRHTDVLNGIAWDEERKLLLITGKYWPKLFAVTLRPAASPAR